MDNDQRFWVRIWSLGLAAFTVLVLAVAYHNTHKMETLNSAIDRGVNPQVANCAIENLNSTPVCVALATKTNLNTGE